EENTRKSQKNGENINLLREGKPQGFMWRSICDHTAFKKRGGPHLYSRQQVDSKYSLLVKSYPRELWMSKKKTREKVRKTEKTLIY
ncbi:hypothetical protein ACFFK0_22955, partial [Paenibacillus chartarius]